MTRILQYATPAILGVLVLAFWELIVRHFDVPPYVLPAPSAVAAAFADNFSSLMASLWTTLHVTLEAFALAVAGGVALAILFSQNKAIENALYPYAVVLQVTPVVAIAPLILIWVGFERINLALVIIAFIVAFFPILSNTTLGLRSTDRNLIDLCRCFPLADSRESANAVGAALSAGRDEDLRRPCAHWRRSSGIRRRFGHSVGIGLAHRRSRQSSGDCKNVCSLGAPRRPRHRDLFAALARRMGAAPPLARKRAREAAIS
jgi:ABC-type amino acid transport system permease subunit